MKKSSSESSTVSLDTLSQGQLIKMAFVKHKVAYWSLFLLLTLYFLAFFAEVVAPYPSVWKSLDHIYAPPQPIRMSIKHGLHVNTITMYQDPITFKKEYIESEKYKTPLSFFVLGEPYKLFNIVPLRLHLFGIDTNKYYKLYGKDAPLPVFFVLGADRYGRDVLSRIIYGSRISLSIGLISIVITFFFGIVIGGISGYVGGKTDTVIQRVIEVINSFPQLPLWLALGAALPADWSSLRIYFAITIVLSLLGWTDLARVVRGKVLALREEDYAVAARLLGASHSRIIFKHLLPGFASHIIVALTLRIPIMILGETSLSFLGLGLKNPIVSWGVMLQDCMSMQVVSNYPWLLFPLLFIILTVLCFNFLGDGLRDAADPYSTR